MNSRKVMVLCHCVVELECEIVKLMMFIKMNGFNRDFWSLCDLVEAWDWFCCAWHGLNCMILLSMLCRLVGWAPFLLGDNQKWIWQRVRRVDSHWANSKFGVGRDLEELWLIERGCLARWIILNLVPVLDLRVSVCACWASLWIQIWIILEANSCDVDEWFKEMVYDYSNMIYLFWSWNVWLYHS